MCRTDSRLARKADTWYSGCTKKVMFQKHTGTAILLKWLKPITVHEGAMSIIHYRTLRANPTFFFFLFKESFICHVINTYDTIDPSPGGFWVWWWTEEGKEDPAAISILRPPSASASGDTVLRQSPCRWCGSMLLSKSNEGALQPKQPSLTSESSPEFGESACGSGQDKWNTKKEGKFGQQFLAYVWLLQS